MFFHDIKYLRKTKMKNWLIIRTFKQLTVDCHILKEYDSISGLKDVNVRIFINIIYAFRWLVLFFFLSSLAQQPISPHSIGYFRDRNGVGWNRCCVRKWESAKLNDNQHDFVCVFFSLSLKFPTSHYLILKIWLGILEFHSNVQRFIDRICIYLIQIVCPPNGWNVHLKRKSSQHERHRQHYLHK